MGYMLLMLCLRMAIRKLLREDFGAACVPWCHLGARGPFFEKKVAVARERRIFQKKKVAVARELGMGNHHSRATATFFLKNAPRSSHSHFFGDRRTGHPCCTFTGPFGPPEPLIASSVWGIRNLSIWSPYCFS